MLRARRMRENDPPDPDIWGPRDYLIKLMWSETPIGFPSPAYLQISPSLLDPSRCDWTVYPERATRLDRRMVLSLLAKMNLHPSSGKVEMVHADEEIILCS